jgi:GH24 family phage-related lysozyme (muramidase)
VFVGRSVPLQVEKTRGVYDSFADLPGLCRSVLVSLVFNRGTQLEDRPGDDRRKEMRKIRDLLEAGNLADVADQILSMRRLWPNSAGLRGRREREAQLWLEGIGSV